MNAFAEVSSAFLVIMNVLPGFTIGATGIKYHVFKIPYAKSSEEMIKNAKILASVSPRWTGQMGTTHSFGMTENYLMFIEQPYIVSTKRIAASFVRGDTLKGNSYEIKF